MFFQKYGFKNHTNEQRDTQTNLFFCTCASFVLFLFGLFRPFLFFRVFKTTHLFMNEMGGIVLNRCLSMWGMFGRDSTLSMFMLRGCHAQCGSKGFLKGFIHWSIWCGAPKFMRNIEFKPIQTSFGAEWNEMIWDSPKRVETFWNCLSWTW